MTIWNAPSDMDHYGPEAVPMCSNCHEHPRASNDGDMCDRCWEVVERELAEWYADTANAHLEAVNRTQDPRTAHERRCSSCQTWVAAKDMQNDTCGRCIREYRAVGGWCNTCRVPKWTRTHCEGCK